MLLKKVGGEIVIAPAEGGLIHLQIQHEGQVVAGIMLKPQAARQFGIDLIKTAAEAIASAPAPIEEGEDYGRIG